MKSELNNEYNNKDAINHDIRSFEKDEDFDVDDSIFNKRSIFVYTYEHANVSLI